MTVRQSIRKVHLTKLEAGDSDPGAAAGQTLRYTHTYAGLPSGGTLVARSYDDATTLPDPVVAWSPDDEASLQIWLDPTDASSITASTNDLTQLADKSGNGYHFTPGSTTPQTGTRLVNSRNVIDFDGVDDYIENTGYSFPVSWQIILAFVPDSVSGSSDGAMRAGGTSRMFLLSGHATQFQGYVDMNGASNVNGGGSADLIGAAHIVRLVFDNATNDWLMYVDGALVHTSTDGYQTVFNDERLVFMSYHPTVGFLNGAFAGAQVFTDITDTVGQKAEGWLADLLNVTLDAGHPYVGGPP